MRFLRNQRGFGLLEALVSSLVSLSVLGFFLTAIYTCIARYWLEQASYDTLICLAEGSEEGLCRENLLSKVSWLAKMESSSLHLESLENSWKIRSRWKLFRGIEIPVNFQLNSKDLEP